MFAIFKKELRSYFINAIGYVFVGVFLAASALLCCYTTLGAKSYSTASYFKMMNFAFIILIPLLTMKLFSEEKKLRTEQLLMTAPVSIPGMILGKFFAAFTLFSGCVLVSCLNFFPLYSYATAERLGNTYAEEHVGPVTAEIVTCVVGLLLVGAAFIAIGLFVSSLTENQLIAAFGTMAILFGMLALGLIGSYVNFTPLRVVISWLSIFTRFYPFTYGEFSFDAIVYYSSIAFVFLFLTVRVFEKRRWD